MNEIGNQLPAHLNLPANGNAARTPHALPPATEQQLQPAVRHATSPAKELPGTWDGLTNQALSGMNVPSSIQETMMDFSGNLARDLNAAQGDAYDIFSRLGSLQTAFSQALSRNSDLLASPSLRSIG